MIAQRAEHAAHRRIGIISQQRIDRRIIQQHTLAAFERGKIDPGDATRNAIKAALESGGAVFIPEDGRQGAGVRLKFTKKDARQINRLESEGGPVGDDDV